MTNEYQNEYVRVCENTHNDIYQFIKLVELTVAITFGYSIGWFWCLIFGCVSWLIVSQRDSLIVMNLISRKFNLLFFGRTSLLLLSISICLLTFSLLILFAQGYILFKNIELDNNPVIKSAKLEIISKQEELNRLINESRFDKSTIDDALKNESRLKIKLKTAQEKVGIELAATLKDWDTEKARFFNRKHKSGLPYQQIMDNDCKPKTTSYGVMRTAANEICPEWRELQTKRTAIKNSQDVKDIQTKIDKLFPILDYSDQITDSRDNLSILLLNLKELKSISGGVIENNGYDLILFMLNKFVTISSNTFICILIILIVILLIGTMLQASALKTLMSSGNYNIEPGHVSHIKPSWFSTLVKAISNLIQSFLNSLEKKDIKQSEIRKNPIGFNWPIVQNTVAGKQQSPKETTTTEQPIEKIIVAELPIKQTTTSKPMTGHIIETKQPTNKFTANRQQPNKQNREATQISETSINFLKLATKALFKRTLVPSVYGIKKWAQENSFLIKQSQIKKWQAIWITKGFIKSTKSTNGKNTFKRVNNWPKI